MQEQDRAAWRPEVVDGGRTTVDPRVSAVLEVLAGEPVPVVAQRWKLDAAVLHRWVGAFVEAGTAQVTNTPVADAAQQRDRFLAAFAHELRTPLTTAQGWVAMLAEGDVPPAAVARTVGRLDEALERLTERVLDVELLASASLGRLQLRPGRVTVAQLTAGLEGLTEIGGLGGDVELTVDPGLFRRVLRDLWVAGHAEPAPRDLRLEVHQVGPWTELRVIRAAEPIDLEVLQALFEPFDRNADTTGVTIGLYLARALVVAHAGTLGADQDDTGAVLWVRVPHRSGPVA